MRGGKVPVVQYDFLTISELAVELGRRAKALRLWKRLEQVQVAEKAGISVRTLRGLELGQGSSLETLLRVMKALGTLDGLNALFPATPAVDPLAMLKGQTTPQRIYKKRGGRE
jgi:transcriptional regulator with XRE-family HTH domain